MHNQLYRKSFANTLVFIDSLNILNKPFDFDVFMNEHDVLCWEALDDGDVVPRLYVTTICEAISEHFPKYKGLYRKAYNDAVAKSELDREMLERISLEEFA